MTYTPYYYELITLAKVLWAAALGSRELKPDT